MTWCRGMLRWLHPRAGEGAATDRLNRATAENETASRLLWSATVERYVATSHAYAQVTALREMSEASLRRVIAQREEHHR